MASAPTTGPMIRVFGGVGVADADGPISIGGSRQRRLLALLAVRAGMVVSVDWLAEYLWSDDERPQATVPAIRTYVSRLRQALPNAAREWIETEPLGYRLAAPAEVVEHLRFGLLRSDAARARESDDPLTAYTLLDEALALWRGEPFRELEDLDWSQADIERLNLDRLEMLEERWEAALALGRHTQITGELAAFTAKHGHRDRAVRQYALALHRSGRTAEALRVVADHRRRLADESGLDPSAGIVDLERSLLAGDPSLSVDKIGRPLRGYRLLEEAGSGAFSVVWRGEQPSVQREVAIKQIRSELASQPEFIRRFEAEAHLVARLEHPHIVPLIDYWRDPDSAYLVMRWLRGGTLERRLDDGSLSLEHTMLMARQIGGALSIAHGQGIVHRDVKTANILFDEQGNAFLGDFGIALEATESTGPEAALSPGSPVYASPEQIRHERLGPEADVFSLGVVIFECLTGSLPFPATSSVEEAIDRQLNVAYPSLAELRADIPEAVSGAVAKATAKDAIDRFASIAEFLDALDTGAANEPDATDPAERSLIGADTNNPYLGLRAFDDADSDRFFGRDRLVNEMASRFDGGTVASRCVVVVGPSGSGKSSVVRAGLVPALRAGAAKGSSDWFSTTMVPGDDPFESLEAALLRIAINPPPSLVDLLRDGPRGILRGVRRCLGTDDDNLLLVIDQLEELFVGRSAQDAHQFLESLAVAVDDPTSPLRLVATLRADFYHRPLEHPTFAPVLTAGSVDVMPLAADELERAIVEPAAQLGIGFEPGLVAQIAAETVGQPSPLPLLQYTLSELFDRRVPTSDMLTLEVYDKFGGLSGALAARSDALYDEADRTQQAAIRNVFGRLTNPSRESADLRRRVAVADLGNDPATTWVIERFAAARLVTLDRDATTREPTVEVAHEALLREWPRLVGWLEEDRDLLRATDLIASAASEWAEGGRAATDLYRGDRLESAIGLAAKSPDRLRPLDNEFIETSRSIAQSERHTEELRVQRLRRLVGMVGGALVIALIAAGLALRAQQRADEQTEQAELATLITQSAAASADDDELSILLALEAHRQSPGSDTEQAVLNALGSSTLPRRLARVDELEECSTAGVWLDRGLTTEFVSTEDTLISRDTLTDERIEHGMPPAPCVSWVGSPVTDRRLALAFPEKRLWFASFEGPWDLERQLDDSTFVVNAQSFAFNAAHRVLLSDQAVRGAHAIVLLDDRTGDPVGDPVAGDGDWVTGRLSPDGTYAAVSFARPDESGEVLVVDGLTGTALFRLGTDSVVTSVTFDDVAEEVVLAAVDGTLATVDLTSGESIGQVRRSAATRLLDVGLRDDGQLAVVSSGLVEIVDRRSGPTGVEIAIPDTFLAQLRPDGRLVIASSDGAALETYDLAASALTDTSIDVARGTQVSIEGIAWAIDDSTFETELLHLGTREREVLPPLVTVDGEVFPIAFEWANENRLVVSRSAQVARWDNGVMVEQISLGVDGMTFFAGQWKYEDRIVIATITPDGTQMLHLINSKPGELDVISTVADDDAQTFSVTADGFVIVRRDGILRIYDDTGMVVDEISTGLGAIPEGGGGSFHLGGSAGARDEATGLIAMATLSGVVLFDPETKEVELVPTFNQVRSVLFARSGELLLIGDDLGAVRLWDISRKASRGVLLRNLDGIGLGGWYDDESDSIWVSDDTRLLELPLDPDVFLNRACEVVDRDLTQLEWDTFVGLDGEVRSACDENGP